MSQADLVSVIIPAFNAKSFLAAAIDSVLVQDHHPIEIIVVDDGSSDDTAAIAASYGASVICVSQANSGPAAARNLGISLAQGDFIGFLDSDDIYEPGRVRLQLCKLAQYPAVDIAMGRMLREKLISPDGAPPVFAPMFTEDHISNQFGVGLYRRGVFDRVGMLEESLQHCEDWDWFMRARELGLPMLLHDEIVLRQRLHHHNLTRDVEAGKRYRFLMLKRSIDRRRAENGFAESLPTLDLFSEHRRCS